MKAVVHELWPSRWLRGQWHASRIGSHAGNLVTSQELVGGRSKPCGMARLGRDVTGEAPAEHAEKGVRRPAIERQAWWKLYEEAPKTLSERGHLEEKSIKLRFGPNESLQVRNHPGDLD